MNARKGRDTERSGRDDKGTSKSQVGGVGEGGTSRMGRGEDSERRKGSSASRRGPEGAGKAELVGKGKGAGRFGDDIAHQILVNACRGKRRKVEKLQDKKRACWRLQAELEAESSDTKHVSGREKRTKVRTARKKVQMGEHAKSKTGRGTGCRGRTPPKGKKKETSSAKRKGGTAKRARGKERSENSR